MTTSMISAALPVAPSNKSHVPASKQGEDQASSPSFSSVLTSQQRPKTAPETDAPAQQQVPGQADVVQHDPAQPQAEATEETDAELAQLAGEQGLTLPQIALNIATEAALVAAAQPVASRAAGQAKLPATAPANHQPLNTAIKTAPAQAGVAVQAGLAQASAPTVGGRQHTPLQTAAPAITTQMPVPGSTLPLPARFTPALAAAAPHQTELNARRPGLPANVRPGLLATPDHAPRTGSASLGKLAVDFSAIIASQADRAGIANTAPIDLITAQAGSAASGSAAALSAQFTSGTGINTATPAALHAAIATPLQNPQWASDFGRQFISLSRGGHNMPHTAELRLDPPELGPLRISINISDNIAHAIFTSPHAAVRQTVENALPQLQQMLEQAGLSLGQASVNDQGQSGQSFNESPGGGRSQTTVAANSLGSTGAETQQPATRSRAPHALVDTFA